MSLKREIVERVSAVALKVPAIRQSVQRATALALKYRQFANRRLPDRPDVYLDTCRF
jgi:hypothetical protein